jgi:hypothetical protein
MSVGLYVDDSAKMRYRNEEGTRMHQELLVVLSEAGFKMKEIELDEHPERIYFAGRLVKKFSNIYGTGLAVTQPSMHTKIQDSLHSLGVDTTSNIAWMPITKTWSPLQAAQNMKSDVDHIE